jgi:hypothetical protein
MVNYTANVAKVDKAAVGLSGKILLKLQRLNFQDVEIIPFDHCTH